MQIWLDDEREPPSPEWVWIDNALGAIKALRNPAVKVTHISLDHDLGDEDTYGNGYQVIVWIEKKVWTDLSYDPPNIAIHTANPVARSKMTDALRSIAKGLIDRF